MYKVTQEADFFEIKRTSAHILINQVISLGLIYYLGIQLLGNMASKDYFWVTFNSLLLLFILRGFFMQISKLFKNAPVLRIDREGIQIESEGFIPKTEITNIKLNDFVNPKQRLLIFVKNPEDHLSRATGLKKILLGRIYEETGSPIIFRLKGSFDRDKLSDFLEKY